jgi:small subunit ribosomal protein S15
VPPLPLKIRKNTKFAMYLTTEIKQDLFKKHGFGKKKEDSGSAESQIALFTHRIIHLTEHLKNNKKDFSTQQGLMKLVGKRKKLLNYLQHTNIDRYRAILADLELRK